MTVLPEVGVTTTRWRVNNHDLPRDSLRGAGPYDAEMEAQSERTREIIEVYRELRNLSQAEVARRIGRAEATVRRWEAGETTPTYLDLWLLAKGIGVSVCELFDPPLAIADYIAFRRSQHAR